MPKSWPKQITLSSGEMPSSCILEATQTRVQRKRRRRRKKEQHIIIMMIIKMQLCTKAYHYIRLYSQLVDLYNMPPHGIICEEQPVSEDFTLRKRGKEKTLPAGQGTV
jgi:hypothetical protein